MRKREPIFLSICQVFFYFFILLIPHVAFRKIPANIQDDLFLDIMKDFFNGNSLPTEKTLGLLLDLHHLRKEQKDTVTKHEGFDLLTKEEKKSLLTSISNGDFDGVPVAKVFFTYYHFIKL